MVRAGEVGGVLESVLERLADYLESSQKARDEIRAAMTYPMILGVVGSLSIVILLTYVLPKFALVFADIGAALPASTRFVMSMSEALQSYWWVAVVADGRGSRGFPTLHSNPLWSLQLRSLAAVVAAAWRSAYQAADSHLCAHLGDDAQERGSVAAVA